MPHIPESDRIRLDNPTLEERSQLYPEQLRESFVWLGCYVREDCARDIDVLVERARALGINHDKTTWSKILRGKWNRDAHGRETTPCVAMEKLLRSIEQLRNDSQIKEQGGRIAFVETSTSQMITNFINIKRSPDRVNKFGVIIGETGTQKTATLREYTRRNNHGATVWMDAPERANMYKFKTMLAKCYGVHVASSMAKKEAKIEESVNWRKTIIVENVQRLYNPRESGSQEVFAYLQTLQERTNCCIILTFTPNFEQTFTRNETKSFFEQFIGRAGGVGRFLRLDQYPPDEDVEAICKAFKLTGLKDQTTWPLSNDKVEKLTVLEYMIRVAHEPGRVRRLFEDLQDAKIAAEAAKEPLTIHHIKAERGED